MTDFTPNHLISEATPPIVLKTMRIKNFTNNPNDFAVPGTCTCVKVNLLKAYFSPHVISDYESVQDFDLSAAFFDIGEFSLAKLQLLDHLSR